MNIALIIVLFIVGVLIGYLLARASNTNHKRVQELKNELTNARKAQQESLEQVNQALESVKNLAQNMAFTYKSLEFTKASLEGREVNEKDFLLQIKDGKLERISYDVDAELPLESQAQTPAESTNDKPEEEKNK
ncbi:ZapG family protein [Psittacicella gerlachiana]|uniref:DUF1043 family protein n=1 Tax=Psittacicella gerlachiana TaxID=2028574 RepID=A0A3A1Y2Z4_9GAMM|nr:DUF1043 family protein [Psittacicella gerlachiana]RIY31588.1 hypothetical protein CKF59_07545 [Psittacicella gerlachiana]